MGLFSAKKTSSKTAKVVKDVAPVVVAEPSPPPPPEPEPVVEVETVPNYLSLLIANDASYVAQPRPPPPAGYVSPLANWLDEYGTGPFLSKDGGKPEREGDKNKDEDGSKDTSSSPKGTASKEDIEDVEEEGGKKSASKEGSEQPSEFTKVKKSSRSRGEGHDSADRAERQARREARAAERAERAAAAEAERAPAEADLPVDEAEQAAVEVEHAATEEVDLVDEPAAVPAAAPAAVKAKKESRQSRDIAAEPAAVKVKKESRQSRDIEPTAVKAKKGSRHAREVEEEFKDVEEEKADAEVAVSEGFAEQEPQRKTAKPFVDALEEDLEEDLLVVHARDDEPLDAADMKAVNEMDMEPAAGKKVRVLDTGSEPTGEKYTDGNKDLPDQGELSMLKDKLRQLQQKLADERAEKMDLQRKVKDRDREIFSLSKQLDKMEAQAERYERFERFGAHGSSASLHDSEMGPHERDLRSADDLQVALKAFKEHSNAKLQETFKQNADLRHQVESYEILCRTIGEVLRDYEWLQQCRIVTGDLDYSRLRKAMMKLWHTGKTRAVLPVVAMVLAFGPDEVARCRHVLNSAKQDADMVDYIPEIIEHNMDETMKRDSITVYIEAHKQLTEDTEIALYLTDRFAERYKGEWHCVVGEQYALSSCYESKVIKFKSGHRSVILWSN